LEYRTIPSLNGTEWKLLVEVLDKEPKKDVIIGYTEVGLNNMADTIAREEAYELLKRKKKDRPGGSISLSLRIRPEVRTASHATLSIALGFTESLSHPREYLSSSIHRNSTRSTRR